MNLGMYKEMERKNLPSSFSLDVRIKSDLSFHTGMLHFVSKYKLIEKLGNPIIFRTHIFFTNGFRRAMKRGDSSGDYRVVIQH